MNYKLSIGLLFTLLCFAAGADDFNVGFNQAWVKNNYAHQWTDKDYDPQEVTRLLDLTQKSGAKVMRMWLFEGASSDALIWENGKVKGLHPDFLKNYQHFLTEAKKRGIQVYPTLFSPGVLAKSTDKKVNETWWNLYNNQYGALDAFKTNALNPLMDLMYSSENRDTIFGIDLANEIDSGVIYDKFENGWSGANKFICNLRDSIHQKAKQVGKSPIDVTASVGWGLDVFPKHSGKIPTLGYTLGAEHTIVEPNPHPDCIDFWDLHVYDDNGDIKNCQKIKAQVKRFNKKIVLGEFGQHSKSFDDNLQNSTTINFIKNAKNCGFSGALAWRLSDVREGINPEARHSFESGGVGKMRPAYQTIKEFNSGVSPTNAEKQTGETSINNTSRINVKKMNRESPVSISPREIQK